MVKQWRKDSAQLEAFPQKQGPITGLHSEPFQVADGKPHSGQY